MKIEEAQEMMRRIYLERDRERGIDRTILRTFQELSELTEAILNDEGIGEIADEFGDVFAWLCSLANLMNVNIAEAFYSKYSDVCSKCKKSPCICPSE